MKKVLFILLLLPILAKSQSGAYLINSDSTIKGQHQISSTKYWDSYSPVYKLMRRNDSVFARQGGAWVFYYKDSTGGATVNPAGNYGNVQLNRNGSFDTPSSDTLGYTTSGGLSVTNLLYSKYDGSNGISLTANMFGSGGTLQGVLTTGSSKTLLLANDGGDISFRTGFASVVNITNAGALKPLYRFETHKGADVSSANDLTLGGDGNVFHITAATTINAITTTNWQAGSEITLIFDSTPTVKNNTAGGAGTAVMHLAGAADFSATANDVLKLVYDGTAWYEVSRSIN